MTGRSKSVSEMIDDEVEGLNDLGGEASSRGAVATIKAARLQALVAADLIAHIASTRNKVVTSVDELSTRLDRLTTATSTASQGLERWTKWLVIATVVLALFTAAQVYVTWSQR